MRRIDIGESIDFHKPEEFKGITLYELQAKSYAKDIFYYKQNIDRYKTDLKGDYNDIESLKFEDLSTSIDGKNYYIHLEEGCATIKSDTDMVAIVNKEFCSTYYRLEKETYSMVNNILKSLVGYLSSIRPNTLIEMLRKEIQK